MALDVSYVPVVLFTKADIRVCRYRLSPYSYLTEGLLGQGLLSSFSLSLEIIPHLYPSYRWPTSILLTCRIRVDHPT